MSGSESDWVFAYGSNMSTDDLRRWLAERGRGADGILRVASATLPGYRLVWNYYSTTRDGGAANVEPCPGRELPGLALQVDRAALKAIDEKEGHPRFYSRGDSRRTLTVARAGSADGGTISAWVYVATASRCRTEVVPPRRAYLRLLITAAVEHRLPDWHVAELEATPTLD